PRDTPSLPTRRSSDLKRQRTAAVQKLRRNEHVFPSTLLPFATQSARMKATELFDLSGEVALVIGATGALGGAIAEGLGGAGARRSEEHTSELQSRGHL